MVFKVCIDGRTISGFRGAIRAAAQSVLSVGLKVCNARRSILALESFLHDVEIEV